MMEIDHSRRPLQLWAGIAIAALCANIGLIALLTRCHSNGTTKKPKELPIEQRLESLEIAYDQACGKKDLGGARVALLEMARLQEHLTPADHDAMTDERAADTSFNAYGLLYCLDRRVGASESSKADLIGARYWRLRGQELSGLSEHDAVSDAAALTGDKLVHGMRRVDRSSAFTEGNTTRPELGERTK